jgi:hypothetical protein
MFNSPIVAGSAGFVKPDLKKDANLLQFHKTDYIDYPANFRYNRIEKKQVALGRKG